MTFTCEKCEPLRFPFNDDDGDIYLFRIYSVTGYKRIKRRERWKKEYYVPHIEHELIIDALHVVIDDYTKYLIHGMNVYTVWPIVEWCDEFHFNFFHLSSFSFNGFGRFLLVSFLVRQPLKCYIERKVQNTFLSWSLLCRFLIWMTYIMCGGQKFRSCHLLASNYIIVINAIYSRWCDFHSNWIPSFSLHFFVRSHRLLKPYICGVCSI